MKVEWLNDDLDQARVVIGHLWWKRCAMVQRREPEEWAEGSGTHWWTFVPSERKFPLWEQLEQERDRERARRDHQEDWAPWPPPRRKSLSWAKIPAVQRETTLTRAPDAGR